MSKSQLIEQGAWAFVAASFAFIIILTRSDALAIPGSWISTLLLAAGMVALRAAYKGTISQAARNFLLLGAIGPILWLVVCAVLLIEGYGTSAQMAATGSWVVIFGGPVGPLLALTLFGLTALKDKPMARLNWQPVLAGVWYPIGYSFLAGYLFTQSGKFPQDLYPLFELTCIAQFFGLLVLGIVLLIERPAQQSV